MSFVRSVICFINGIFQCLVTHLRFILIMAFLFTHSGRWASYVVMYLLVTKQCCIFFPQDFTGCLGNFFADFVWLHLSICIYFKSWMDLKVQDDDTHIWQCCLLSLASWIFSTWPLICTGVYWLLYLAGLAWIQVDKSGSF